MTRRGLTRDDGRRPAPDGTPRSGRVRRGAARAVRRAAELSARWRRVPRPIRALLRAALAAAVLIAAFRWLADDEPEAVAANVSASRLLAFETGEDGDIPYAKLMQDHPDAAEPAPGAAPIELDPAAYDRAAPEARLVRGGADGAALEWRNESGWVEWTFDVPAGGWYELHVTYMPLEGGNGPVVRGVRIDGRYPFQEAAHLELERHWKDAKYPYDRNELGMQVRPLQTELTGWKAKAVDDYAVSSRPLLFRLEQGAHTLRLEGGREPVALRGLAFRPPPTIPSYAEYVAARPAADGQTAWFGVTEAEQFQRKSALTIQTDHWSEPYISPDPKGRITYNVLGGQRWRQPGEWVEWSFEVPADGWYEILLKNYQNYRAGFKAYRTIEIDGQTPFRELLHYGIAYHKEFEIAPIADASGTPYRFYLTQGRHTIRMIADASELQPVILALRDTLERIAAFDRHIRLLTGNYSKSSFDANLDANRTWDMARYDPDAAAKIEAMIARLRDIQAYLSAVNGGHSDLAEAIRSSIDMLDDMREDVNEIPSKINDFATIQSQIGTWMSTLTQQQLALDYIVVRTPGARTGLKEPTALARIPYALADFGRSFTMDYGMRRSGDPRALEVWVQRGRDYVELLQELADQEFTPETGIRVNFSLMPNPNVLILGNAAGDVPDVALGVGEGTPADYAMRQAVEDLSAYPGFEDVRRRFIPGVMRALAYDGGVYGLPEVQNFQVLFYRTDIFARLGLKPPDTWEDVFDLLPTLQENGMTMHVPKADFPTFFLQHGAEPYAPNGLDAELTSAAGKEAFRMWTELYTKYNLPIDIPAFFQHFRDGDIPIGIADFNAYVQLLVAAPEITGHWKIAPLPGIRQPDGEVARWSPQGLSAAMIMKKSQRKDAAWTFLQWWTSDDVQARYAKDIESFYGLEFRWNTANVGAMRALHWPADDLAAIREQTRWAKNMPNVPGYYFLAREMEFAWNRTVFDGMPAEESLEEAQLSLQREMDRRQRDFGISRDDDLRVPQVTKPFEWGEASP